MESTYSLTQYEKYEQHHCSQPVSTRTAQGNCGRGGAFILSEQEDKRVHQATV